MPKSTLRDNEDFSFADFFRRKKRAKEQILSVLTTETVLLNLESTKSREILN